MRASPRLRLLGAAFVVAVLAAVPAACAEGEPRSRATDRPNNAVESAAEQSRPAESQAAASQPASTQSPAAAAEDNTAVSVLGCVLVLVIVGLFVGGLVLSRSQRRSAWDRQAQQLRSSTVAAAESRVPPVLNTTGRADRGVVWPPIRTGLVGLVDQWDLLVESAPGESRREWALRLNGLLRELIAAVDAESESIAAGRSWRVLRPRVLEAQLALDVALTVGPDAAATAGRPMPPSY
ncbi:hypothetical protein [Cryptosporangium minutisporangium]|uniref:Uncharacterized protein n=1 Tax=Cryptosporangium minutisporangium TaxID=113569 RepID=A0ABP6SZ61_9ACTN